MRSKKMISILSAAAITASSMAYLTAFAADEVLYSDSFNGYETSGNIVLNNEGTPTVEQALYLFVWNLQQLIRQMLPNSDG